MSILASLFGGTAPTAAAPSPAAGQAPVSTPGQAPTQNQGASPTNIPTGQAADPTAPAQKPEGVAALFDLFASNEGEGGKPAGAPELNLTSDLLQQATKDINFMRGVSEEMIGQVQQGDTNALMALIQTAVRNGYESAMLDSTQLAGRFAGARSDFAAQQATKGIRSQVIESQVEVENLSPAAQTMFRQIASKVAERNPTATANEVKTQATALLQQLAQEFNFQGIEQKARKPVEDDWSKVFG